MVACPIANRPMNRHLLAVLLGLAGVVIFGATLPMTRLAVAEIDPYAATAGRALVAGALATITLLVLRCPFPRQYLRAFCVIALTIVLGWPILTALAMTTVPAAHGGVVTGLLPLATAMAAAALNRERPSWLFWLCGIAGSAVVVAFALRDGGGGLEWGDVLLVGAVASAATGYAVSGRLSVDIPGWEVISWALVVALPASALAMLLTWGQIDWSASWPAWAGFAYTAVFSQFIGFFFWNVALAMGGVARIGQLMLFITFVTIAVSAALLGEVISVETWLAAALVVIFVALGQRARVRRD